MPPSSCSVHSLFIEPELYVPYDRSRLSHGHKELCFTLFILLISDDPSCFFFFSNSQMNSFLLHELIPIAETVFYPCFEVQVSADKILDGAMKRADLRWQLYDHAHWCWRKYTAPTTAAQPHLQQGTMAGRNLIRAGDKDTSRKQRGKQLLFSPLLVGTDYIYFTRSRYLTKGCNNLWNKL